MPFKAPSQNVSDPGCQTNWEGLQREDYASAALVAAHGVTLATHTASLDAIGVSRNTSSSIVQGPGPVGADVVYTPISLVIEGGTWLVYAYATASTSVADGKRIALLNAATNFEIAGTAGPVEAAAPAGAGAMLTTFGALSTGAQAPITLKILVKRNGGSALTIGYPGALTNAQRIFAIKINDG